MVAKASTMVIDVCGVLGIALAAVVGSGVAGVFTGSPRSAAAKELVCEYAVGIPDGATAMMFVPDAGAVTGGVYSASLHVGKSARLIRGKWGLEEAPAGHSLVLYVNAASGGGWAAEYPDAAGRAAVSEELQRECGVVVREMSGVPSSCGSALGWLCYVPDSQVSGTEGAVAFSALKGLKGAWMYR